MYTQKCAIASAKVNNSPTHAARLYIKTRLTAAYILVHPPLLLLHIVQSAELCAVFFIVALWGICNFLFALAVRLCATRSSREVDSFL